MTITDIPAADEATRTKEIQRASYIDGLRELADVLEEHPEVPLPYDGTDSDITFHFLHLEDPRAAMSAAARAFPCNWRKNAPDAGYGGLYLDLTGELRGLKLKLVAFRDAVCERVVTGTREVTETVKDPEALAAVPEIEVTKVIEDVEWRCGSVLMPPRPGVDVELKAAS